MNVLLFIIITYDPIFLLYNQENKLKLRKFYKSAH